MKFQVYLIVGTSLSCFPALAFGQCVTVQDCSTLGYTASSCNGGKGVKCPFGNGWFCAEDESTVCAENGFKYSCTGTGYAGGAGSVCGGKYAQCTCASGYEWKDNSCKPKISDGAHGDLYYCNGKVVGVKVSEMNFYVAMKDLGSMTWDNARNYCAAYSFCGNLKGTLPSREQLLTMYNNKSSLNNLLSANGGIKLTEDYHWSSTCFSDYGDRYYYVSVNMSDGYEENYRNDLTSYARPVLVDY